MSSQSDEAMEQAVEAKSQFRLLVHFELPNLNSSPLDIPLRLLKMKT
jgi:hypothetical protein